MVNLIGGFERISKIEGIRRINKLRLKEIYVGEVIENNDLIRFGKILKDEFRKKGNLKVLILGES